MYFDGFLAAASLVILFNQVLSLPVQEPLLLDSLNPYPNQRALHFNKHSAFKVVVITDTHLLDDQNVAGNRSNVNYATTSAVETYLEVEKPDFVVHLGDIISGEVAKNTSDVVGAVRQVLSPMGE
jgi:predicted MPP superfamily phosphohydrolase